MVYIKLQDKLVGDIMKSYHRIVRVNKESDSDKEYFHFPGQMSFLNEDVLQRLQHETIGLQFDKEVVKMLHSLCNSTCKWKCILSSVLLKVIPGT